MASNYPTSIDNFLNPVGTDKVNNANAALVHSTQHSQLNDAVEALEAKVGADASAVTTSHDYKLSGVTSAAKAVSNNSTENIGGVKTFTTSGGVVATSPRIITSINDTNGNEVIKIPATASAVNEITVTNAATGTDVQVSATGDDTNISVKITPKGTGSIKLGNGNLKFPNADGSNNQIIKTDGTGQLSFASISSITGQPWTLDSKFIFSDWLANLYTDNVTYICKSTTILKVAGEAYRPQTHDVTTDWASAQTIFCAVIIGSYLYVLMYDASTNQRVYRYDPTNLAAGGTQMTFSGGSLGTTNGSLMTSDGTNFYFSADGGNSANTYIIAKYTLSGTTFTYVSSITCGSTQFNRYWVKSNGDIYAATTDAYLHKYNSSGVEQWVTADRFFVTLTGGAALNIADTLYFAMSDGGIVHGMSRFYVD